MASVTGQWRAVATALTERDNSLSDWIDILHHVEFSVYIYAIQTGQATEASLGYYITPLVNAALGMLVPGRSSTGVVARARRFRLRFSSLVRQRFSGLVILGRSFGYALLRKTAPVGACPPID